VRIRRRVRATQRWPPRLNRPSRAARHHAPTRVSAGAEAPADLAVVLVAPVVLVVLWAEDRLSPETWAGLEAFHRFQRLSEQTPDRVQQ
jgi:hypothetical protein